MRKIVEGVSRELALEARDCLESEGIDAEVRGEGEIVDIWIFEEDHFQKAAHVWESFLVQPRKPRSISIQRKEIPPIPNRVEINASEKSSWLPVTVSIMLVSIGLSIVSFGPLREKVLTLFLISQYKSPLFIEVSAGEVWRIFTPTLLHGGFFHLIFNVFWMFHLGQIIEKNEGSIILVGQTILIGSLGNVAQYLVTGPMFMGLSGVIYGLFGYVWMMVTFKKIPDYQMSQHTIAMMMFFLFICMIGIVANVANTVHFVGLSLGVIWGIGRSLGIKGAISLIKSRLRR